jgi:hypothetical protein
MSSRNTALVSVGSNIISLKRLDRESFQTDLPEEEIE